MINSHAAVLSGLTLALCACSSGSTTNAAVAPAMHDGSLRFVDGLAATGTSAVSFGRAAAMVDMDNDGYLDLVLAHTGMPNSYFRQLSDHTFEDAGPAWGIVPDNQSHWGLVACDLDNDGDQDLFFANGGFKLPEPNQVFRNDINTGGGLVDFSARSWDGNWNGRNFSATALDHDNDGLLDLFVTDAGKKTRSIFLHNNGGLQLQEIGALIGITEIGSNLCSSSGDYDNDGWPDIATADFAMGPRLYHNQGDGRFSEESAAAGLNSPASNFGLVLEDFDNDGLLDLFLPKYVGGASSTQSRLYLNEGDGTFADITGGAKMTPTTAMGHNTGDLDSDGYPDIVIGTGSPSSTSLDYLYLTGKPDPTDPTKFAMLDASTSSGITSKGETRCHGMAIGDYDEDGDVDIYFNNGGPQDLVGTLEENAFWINTGNDNNWATVDIEGVISNRPGIGARLAVKTSAGRFVYRYKRAGHGFGNTNSPIQHFGIGEDAFIEQLYIQWPSGVLQTVTAPPMGQRTFVMETGLLLPSGGDQDGVVEVLAVGPAGHEVELFLGLPSEPRAVADHTVNGRSQLTAPHAQVASGRLNALGKLTLFVDLPEGVEPRDLALQAWVRAPGATGGGTLTNRLDLE